jgi:MtfA peptidase
MMRAMFGLWRRWRRRRLGRRELPATWIPILEDRVPFYAGLEGELRERFLDYLKIFVWEKHFIPAGGLEMTEEIQVVIAAAAVRLVLHLDLSYYDRLTEIVVYPSHYKNPSHEGAVVFGEAHNWGVVVLSWDAVTHGLADPHDGHDTATHEFAHVLDRATGRFDGTPRLRASANYRCWGQVMSRHFEALRSGDARVLREYGAQNEAEFFAVATETFFEKPDQLARRAPDLYGILRRFYGFDPAENDRASRPLVDLS